jgi:hypothetical protein
LAPIESDKYLVKDCFDVVFDGINLWQLVEINNNIGEDQVAALKLDAGKLSLVKPDIDKALADLTSSPILIGPESSLLQISKYKCMTFDGRDIWAIKDPESSRPDSGKIFRIPLALIRS